VSRCHCRLPEVAKRQVAKVVATEKVETGPVTKVGYHCGYHGSAASVVNLDTALAPLPAGERVARGFTRLYRSRNPGQRADERRRPKTEYCRPSRKAKHSAASAQASL